MLVKFGLRCRGRHYLSRRSRALALAGQAAAMPADTGGLELPPVEDRDRHGGAWALSAVEVPETDVQRKGGASGKMTGLDVAGTT